jgi:hypothetical protein
MVGTYKGHSLLAKITGKRTLAANHESAESAKIMKLSVRQKVLSETQ